ncbi:MULTISPECIES: hypothetical protein [Burkholderia cepacia complex]|nr:MULTISPECIES: hypothetical protein [Burkholderia cepacia complex]
MKLLTAIRETVLRKTHAHTAGIAQIHAHRIDHAGACVAPVHWIR